MVPLKDNFDFYTSYNNFFLLQVDRSQLSQSYCYSEDINRLKLQYRVPYTKINCEVFATTETFSLCSLTPFYGIETGHFFANKMLILAKGNSCSKTSRFK